MQYDWTANGAALRSKIDMDNNVSTVYGYDNAGRQTSVVESSGNIGLRGTWTEYDDANRTVTVKSDLKAYGDVLLQTRTYYDQLGRVKLAQQSDGSALTNNTSGIKTQVIVKYPTLVNGQWTGERMTLTTTPYRNLNDTTLEWSCTQYDTVGRIKRVSTFTGSTPPTNCSSTDNRTGVTQMAYNAEWTTATDPAGKVRKQRVDALGRLVEVVEDPGSGPNALNYITAYEYDALDNLTKVTQGG